MSHCSLATAGRSRLGESGQDARNPGRVRQRRGRRTFTRAGDRWRAGTHRSDRPGTRASVRRCELRDDRPTPSATRTFDARRVQRARRREATRRCSRIRRRALQHQRTVSDPRLGLSGLIWRVVRTPLPTRGDGVQLVQKLSDSRSPLLRLWPAAVVETQGVELRVKQQIGTIFEVG